MRAKPRPHVPEHGTEHGGLHLRDVACPAHGPAAHAVVVLVDAVPD